MSALILSVQQSATQPQIHCDAPLCRIVDVLLPGESVLGALRRLASVRLPPSPAAAAATAAVAAAAAAEGGSPSGAGTVGAAGRPRGQAYEVSEVLCCGS